MYYGPFTWKFDIEVCGRIRRSNCQPPRVQGRRHSSETTQSYLSLDFSPQRNPAGFVQTCSAGMIPDLSTIRQISAYLEDGSPLNMILIDLFSPTTEVLRFADLSPRLFDNLLTLLSSVCHALVHQSPGHVDVYNDIAYR